ncbi:MAG: hypothetical protein AAF634_03525 [Bacteroidota bacterium]
MRKRSKILVIALGIVVLSCITIDDSTDPYMVNATIKLRSPPEGCGDFAVETANDNVLFPVGLDKEYRVDGLRVRIVYDLIDGVTHQCGSADALPSIELLAIERQ